MPAVVIARFARMRIALRAGNLPEETAPLTKAPAGTVEETDPSQVVRAAKALVPIVHSPKGLVEMVPAAIVPSQKGRVGRAPAQTGPIPKDHGARAQVLIARSRKALAARPAPVASPLARGHAGKPGLTGRPASARRVGMESHRPALGPIAPAARVRTRINS
tara:strand:+ start:485 stop:970 length:486 start_codon:yes stop_codon:yes gene_type:complete